MNRLTRRALTAVLVVTVLALPQPAAAHPAPFSYLDVVFRDGAIEGTLVIHVIDAAHELGITPPERLLENEVAERTRDVNDGRIARDDEIKDRHRRGRVGEGSSPLGPTRNQDLRL